MQRAGMGSGWVASRGEHRGGRTAIGWRLACALGIAWGMLGRLPCHAEVPSRPPNIVFLLADDLGWGELGCYGQTVIRTPRIDSLARDGMRLTQHYCGNAVCAPSRCVLMTGLHPGHAFIRDNRSTPPEGQYPIPDETVTLAELLQQCGYVTGGFGKWGLGGPDSPGAPLRQGINRFFGYNCQGVAHNLYPTSLWDNDQRFPLQNPPFSAHQKLPPDASPDDPASYRRYSGTQFAPDLYTAEAVRFIHAHQNRPFFLYYPTIISHLALQVPEDSLREYEGRIPDAPYVGDKGYLPHRTPRAAYAALVTRLDRHVGQILDALAELKLERDTIVVFTSDNGPTYDRIGGTDSDFFHSAGELRGRKGSLYEGGIRAPLLVRWPGHVPAGTVSQHVTGFEDWIPTLLDLIGAGPRTPAHLDGISFAPTLRGQTQPPRPFLYREFPSYGGQQSVRVGDWKGIRQNLLPRGRAAGTAPRLDIELYNLRLDPQESRNVAADHPDIVSHMERLMRAQHTPSAEFPLPALDDLVRGH